MNEEELMEPTPAETPPVPAADADALAELDALRAWKAARLEADALQSRRDAVARLLREDGALPEAVPLLVLSVNADNAKDAETAARAIREAYPGFFREDHPVPTPAVPRGEAGPWTPGREGLAAMSPEDINRRWEEVKAALRGL